MEAFLALSPAHGIKWALPLSGEEEYPPSVGLDEYTIINPDFWGEGVDQSVFCGWSNLSEISNWFHFLFIYSNWFISGSITSTWRSCLSGWWFANQWTIIIYGVICTKSLHIS